MELLEIKVLYTSSERILESPPDISHSISDEYINEEERKHWRNIKRRKLDFEMINVNIDSNQVIHNDNRHVRKSFCDKKQLKRKHLNQNLNEFKRCYGDKEEENSQIVFCPRVMEKVKKSRFENLENQTNESDKKMSSAHEGNFFYVPVKDRIKFFTDMAEKRPPKNYNFGENFKDVSSDVLGKVGDQKKDTNMCSGSFVKEKVHLFDNILQNTGTTYRIKVNQNIDSDAVSSFFRAQDCSTVEEKNVEKEPNSKKNTKKLNENHFYNEHLRKEVKVTPTKTCLQPAVRERVNFFNNILQNTGSPYKIKLNEKIDPTKMCSYFGNNGTTKIIESEKKSFRKNMKSCKENEATRKSDRKNQENVANVDVSQIIRNQDVMMNVDSIKIFDHAKNPKTTTITLEPSEYKFKTEKGKQSQTFKDVLRRLQLRRKLRERKKDKSLTKSSMNSQSFMSPFRPNINPSTPLIQEVKKYNFDKKIYQCNPVVGKMKRKLSLDTRPAKSILEYDYNSTEKSGSKPSQLSEAVNKSCRNDTNFQTTALKNLKNDNIQGLEETAKKMDNKMRLESCDEMLEANEEGDTFNERNQILKSLDLSTDHRIEDMYKCCSTNLRKFSSGILTAETEEEMPVLESSSSERSYHEEPPEKDSCGRDEENNVEYLPYVEIHNTNDEKYVKSLNKINKDEINNKIRVQVAESIDLDLLESCPEDWLDEESIIYHRNRENVNTFPTDLDTIIEDQTSENEWGWENQANFFQNQRSKKWIFGYYTNPLEIIEEEDHNNKEEVLTEEWQSCEEMVEQEEGKDIEVSNLKPNSILGSEETSVLKSSSKDLNDNTDSIKFLKNPHCNYKQDEDESRMTNLDIEAEQILLENSKNIVNEMFVLDQLLDKIEQDLDVWRTQSIRAIPFLQKLVELFKQQLSSLSGLAFIESTEFINVVQNVSKRHKQFTKGQEEILLCNKIVNSMLIELNRLESISSYENVNKFVNSGTIAEN